MKHTLHIRSASGLQALEVPEGANLLACLRDAGYRIASYCGGNGSCGKCELMVYGARRLACTCIVEEDSEIAFLEEADGLTVSAAEGSDLADEGLAYAADLGTTTIAAFLLNQSGDIIGKASCLNPQAAYGADVISRLRFAGASAENAKLLKTLAQNKLNDLCELLCQRVGASPNRIERFVLVGNPAMQQLFMGLDTANLTDIPYRAVLAESHIVPAESLLSCCVNAEFLVLEDISAYVGADTLGAMLSTGLAKAEEPTLLVDIGTNGEMVLASGGKLFACATAAGPAFEGANLLFGARAADGIIDHAYIKDGVIHTHSIGDAPAHGICGSAYIDALALHLELGNIDRRGRICKGDNLFLTDSLYLTQEDVRNLQSAKGAISAGICVLAEEAGIGVQDIASVYLAGAFGSYLNADNACRIGLIPHALSGRVLSVGNAAGAGACMLARDEVSLSEASALAKKVQAVDLATHPSFSKQFAKNMYF